MLSYFLSLYTCLAKPSLITACFVNQNHVGLWHLTCDSLLRSAQQVTWQLAVGLWVEWLAMYMKEVSARWDLILIWMRSTYSLHLQAFYLLNLVDQGTAEEKWILGLLSKRLPPVLLFQTNQVDASSFGATKAISTQEIHSPSRGFLFSHEVWLVPSDGAERVGDATWITIMKCHSSMPM